MRKVDPRLLIDPTQAVVMTGYWTEKMLVDAKDELCPNPDHTHFDHIEDVERELDLGLASGQIVEVSGEAEEICYATTLLALMVRRVDALSEN